MVITFFRARKEDEFAKAIPSSPSPSPASHHFLAKSPSNGSTKRKISCIRPSRNEKSYPSVYSEQKCTWEHVRTICFLGERGCGGCWGALFALTNVFCDKTTNSTKNIRRFFFYLSGTWHYFLVQSPSSATFGVESCDQKFNAALRKNYRNMFPLIFP